MDIRLSGGTSNAQANYPGLSGDFTDRDGGVGQHVGSY